jgi:hypothetical protein
VFLIGYGRLRNWWSRLRDEGGGGDDGTEMAILKSILAWELAVLKLSLAFIAVLFVGLLLVAPFAMAWGIMSGKDIIAMYASLFFVGGFVGWFGIGTIIVLLSHLIAWLRQMLRQLKAQSPKNSN